MKNIRYSKQKLDFTTELRNSVNEYFNINNIQPYGNQKIYLKTIFMATLYLAPYILMISGLITSVLLVLACWIVMGLGMSGIGMVTMHDANHGTFSKHKWVNRFFWQFNVPARRLPAELALSAQHAPSWIYQHRRAR